jgi:hypothetical protein
MNTPHTEVDVGGSMRRVHRRIEQGLRLLAEADLRLPAAEELGSLPLTRTEAERVDRYCLNFEVALDDLNRWLRLLSLQANELASRCDEEGARAGARGADGGVRR